MTLAARLSLAALAALSALACSKGSIEKHEVSAEVGTILAALPKDASIVGGVNLAKARGTEVWKKYQAQLLGDLPPELGELKAACGFDPLTQVNTAAVSVGADVEDKKGAVVVVKGDFKEDQIATCVTAMASKAGEQITIAKDGKITKYTDGKGDALHAWWTAADTVVAVPGALDDGAAMKKVVDGAGADQNATIKELLGFVDTGAVLWGAGLLPAQARDQLKMMGYVPDAFFVEVDVPGDVTIALGMRFESDKAAESFYKLAKNGLDEVKKAPPMPQLKPVLDSLEVKQTGRILKLTAKLTVAQIEELAGMAAMMGGGGLPF